MSRLINADALERRYVPIAPIIQGDNVRYEWVVFAKDVDKQPTVDAIPIDWILNHKCFPKSGKGRDAILDMIEAWRAERRADGEETT